MRKMINYLLQWMNKSEESWVCEFLKSTEVLPINLEKDFKKLIKIISYELGSDSLGIDGIDSSKRMPIEWELYGKCENKNWFLLDTQKNIKKWVPNESRIFKLDNSPKEISKIRLVIRRIEDGNTVNIKFLKIHNYESIKELSLKKLKYIKKTLKDKI